MKMAEIQDNNTIETVDTDKSVVDFAYKNLINLKDTIDLSRSGNTIKLPPHTAHLTMTDDVSSIDKKQLNLQKIKESIEIKGELANIQKVRNLDGSVILECRNTPYINIKALEDIIGFAQEFYEKTGTPLTINYAFRTIKYQNKLKKMKGDNAAEPGKSGHNLGLSIDMDRTDRYNTQIGGIKGINRLAKKHNFESTIPGEDWHFDHKSLTKNSDKRLLTARKMDKEFNSSTNKAYYI